MGSPDLGILLVLFTVFQGCEGCPARKSFVDAYVDENFVRCVMWWQDTVPPQAAPVLDATKSRGRFACSSSCCQPLSLVATCMTRCERLRRRIAKSPSDLNFFRAGGVSRKHQQ